MWPELAAVGEVKVRDEIAVETQVLETARFPCIWRREESEFVLCGIHHTNAVCVCVCVCECICTYVCVCMCV